MEQTVVQCDAIAQSRQRAGFKARTDLATRRSFIASIILGSVVVHVIGLVLFGVWVVARQFAKPEAVFQVKEGLKIPIQRAREHRMNVAAHEAAAPKPVLPNKLISTRPSKFSLPELPKLNLQQMLPLNASELVSDQVTTLAGSAGLGLGAGVGLSGSGGIGKTANFSFLGLKADGQRIVLCFDVSGSVVNKAAATGVPLATIKDETNRLITTLPPIAQFGIIQFVRNYKPFREQLVPASPANRDLARLWTETEWNETGQMGRGQRGVVSPEPNGVVCVLDAAFAMKPDVVFVISDGQFEQTYPRNRRIPKAELEAKVTALEKGRSQKVPIHFIGFQMRPEDRLTWERIVRRTGGKLRVIK